MYAGQEQFLAGTTSFIRDSLEAEDPILVVVSALKVELLRAELGMDAKNVHFADMREVGGNPARIIPAWRDFVTDRGGKGNGLRGIGEPIHPDRLPAELVECQRHESLLNLAFADTPAFWLMCPYDIEQLGADVIDEARRSHPHIATQNARSRSDRYRGLDAVAAPFDDPLPEPASPFQRVPFEAASIADIRAFVVQSAAESQLGIDRAEDLALAVSEVAANSVRHGGGRGDLRVWQEDGTLICEIRDDGEMDQPLAGRERPDHEQVGGYGLWLANHLCDLVQIRSHPAGTVVRLHLRPS
jgi:anti-sigma regulatory factor (Ser/Thr protein kinase)